jgi:hypothetical protein
VRQYERDYAVQHVRLPDTGTDTSAYGFSDGCSDYGTYGSADAFAHRCADACADTSADV